MPQYLLTQSQSRVSVICFYDIFITGCLLRFYLFCFHEGNHGWLFDYGKKTIIEFISEVIDRFYWSKEYRPMCQHLLDYVKTMDP